MAIIDDGSCDCSQCGTHHELDSWVCHRCWDPITVAGIHDRQTYIHKDERKNELWDRYGLSATDVGGLRVTPGSNILGLNSEVFNMWTRDRPSGSRFLNTRPRQKRVRRPTAGAPYHASQEGGSRGSGVPAAAARTMRGNAHINDADIRTLIRRALKMRYTSHTDRYQRDGTYRHQCQERNPPTPEWLTFSSGEPCLLVDQSHLGPKGKGKDKGKGK